MWVRNIWDFPFRWVHHLPSSVTVVFRATKISATLRTDVPVVINATKNLEDAMLPVKYWSWQHSFSELPKSYQQWELTFLPTVAFWATKIPTTLKADVPAAIRATKDLEDAMLHVNCQSCQTIKLSNYSCQS